MIAKKNRKADLERKRFAFFQIGLLVSGSLCLAAFEYTSADTNEKFVEIETEDYFGSVEVYHDITEMPKQQEAVNVRQEIVDEVTITNQQVNNDGIIVKNISNIVVDDDGGGSLVFNTLFVEDGDIHDFVSQDPSFIGGEAAMQEWVVKNIQYPEFCADLRIGGTAHIQFVVNTDGSICMVEDVSNENVHEDLRKEAVRVVKKMPKWIPGENAGKKVRVRYTIPIRFVAP